MASANHIRSITDVAEIPFIDTKWNMKPVNPILTSSIHRSDYAVNLHPDVTTLSKILAGFSYLRYGLYSMDNP